MKELVLLIDDEEPALRILKEYLQRSGFKVMAATGGEEGVAMAKALHPDVVVCDINMPDMDGFTVLKEVRTHGPDKQVPFIFLTARSAPTDLRLGMLLGAEDYLCKAQAPEELLSVLKTRIEMRLNEKRREAERLRSWADELSRVLCHELRTPLSAIIAVPDLLDANAEGEARADVRLASSLLRDGAERLQKLVERLLAYSELGSLLAGGKRAALSEGGAPLDVLIANRARCCAQEHARIEDLDLHLDRIGCSGDARYLALLAREMIENAFKFSKPGTRVTVDLISEPTTLLLRVTDHGRGMSEEQVETVSAFRQFQRSVYEQQGLGLGLALIQLIARHYDGEFSIESAVGEGTTICVALPMLLDTVPVVREELCRSVQTALSV